MYSLQRITEPTLEPITLGQAKAQCRIDVDDTSEDELLPVYIKAAREHCEKITGRAILQQTWRLSRDCFPWVRSGSAIGAQHPGAFYGGFFSGGLLSGYFAPILLPRPRLIGIVDVKYWDTTNTLQTLDPGRYAVSMDAEPARLAPVPGTWWPATALRPDAVQVTYNAGYGATADAVPASVQLACLLLVGHWYENREATQAAITGNGPMPLPLGVDALLADETIFALTYEA